MQCNFNSAAVPFADGPAGSLEDDTTGWGSLRNMGDSIVENYERMAELLEGVCGHGMDYPEAPEQPVTTTAPAASAPKPAFLFSGELESDIQALPRLKLRAPRR